MNKYGWKQQKREKKSLSHEDAKINLSHSYDMLMMMQVLLNPLLTPAALPDS